MAVNINIPGFGTVQAENAATESTLMGIIAAIKEQNRNVQSNQDTVNRIQQGQQRQAQIASASMSDVASSSRQAKSAIGSFTQDVSTGLANVNDKVYTFGQYLTDLSAAALKATLAMSTSYRELSTNPFERAKKNVDTILGAVEGLGKTISSISTRSRAIDQASGEMADSATKSARRSALFQNVVGETIQGGAKALGVVNTILGDQLTNTVKNFEEFNRMGTTFFTGMEGMRYQAQRAGVLLDQLAEGTRSAIDSVKSMGLSTAGSVQLMAKVLEQLKVNQDGGVVFQEQLRRLGFEVKDQVALTAGYLSLQRASMSAEEFAAFEQSYLNRQTADETREYAKNMKLLSDLTGKNAEEIARESRSRQLSAVALATLSGDEGERFGRITAGINAKGGAFITKALEQQLALGTIVDKDFNILASAFPELRQTVLDLANLVRNGNLTPEEASQTSLALFGNVAEDLRGALGKGGPLDSLVRANVGGAQGLQGVIGDLQSLTQNTLFVQKDVEAAVIAINRMVEGGTELTNSLSRSQQLLHEMAVEIEGVAGKGLVPYAELITEINQKITDVFKFFMSNLNDTMEFIRGMGNPLDAAQEKFNDLISFEDKGGYPQQTQRIANNAVETPQVQAYFGPGSLDALIRASTEREIAKIHMGQSQINDAVVMALESQKEQSKTDSQSLIAEMAKVSATINESGQRTQLELQQNTKLLNAIARSSSTSTDIAHKTFVYNS
jgi:hypothetical protein